MEKLTNNQKATPQVVDVNSRTVCGVCGVETDGQGNITGYTKEVNIRNERIQLRSTYNSTLTISGVPGKQIVLFFVSMGADVNWTGNIQFNTTIVWRGIGSANTMHTTYFGGAIAGNVGDSVTINVGAAGGNYRINVGYIIE